MADVLFQGIFGRCIAEVERLLPQVADEHVHVPPVPTWVDDAAVMISSQNPCQLVPGIRETVRCVYQALESVGIKTHFEDKKSEVVVVFAGKSSEVQARQWLTGNKPSIDVELCNGVTSLISRLL